MDDKRLTISEIVQTEGWEKFINKLNLYSIVLLGIAIIMIISGINKGFRPILTMTLSTFAITSFFYGLWCRQHFRQKPR